MVSAKRLLNRLMMTLVMLLVTNGTLWAAPSGSTGTKHQIDCKPDEVIIKFRDGQDTAGSEEFHGRHGSQRIRSFSHFRLQQVRIKKGKTVTEAVSEFQDDPAVEYAEPNFLARALVVPSDAYFSSLWGMSKISAPAAWDISTGSSSVVVAVIDTGIDYNHYDLKANLWPGIGYNAITNTSDPKDDNGHGTHVAGTIGGVGNNSVGVAGVNWNVQIMACKFLDSTGTGTYADAIKCLQYIKSQKDAGVNIVATNNSWGGGSYSRALSDAINAQRDILFFAAAGNSGTNNDITPNYPSNYDLPNVIAVAATSSTDTLASFSEYGRRTVDIGAPGVSIFSTLPNGYGYSSGTSMATPHVAGLAALVKANRPAADWRQVKNLILSGGDTVDGLVGKTLTGKRINAYTSVTCVDSRVFSAVQYPAAPTVGVPTTLSALSINCSEPLGPVTVALSGGEVILLKDDGVAPDQAAGDGIFSATYTPAKTSETFNFSSPAGAEYIGNMPPLAISTSSLVSGTVGVVYSQVLTTTSGTAPYTWSVTVGSLPTGLTLSSAGVIGGTPSAAGTFSFTVQVNDALNGAATKAFSISIVNPVIISTNTLVSGTVGISYTQALAATGGTSPYTWSVVSGALPVGLSLSNGGVISGTPATEGNANFTVRVTDAAAITADKALSITVNPSSSTRVNVAFAANGGVATASSFLDIRLVPANLLNGDRTGVNFATGGGGWHDATLNQYPDWVQVAFNGQKSIDEIDVFTVQDNYANPIEPTPTLTFTKYGPTVFDVQYWDGTTWVTVPGGSVTGNNLVWRKFNFTAVTTDRIRVVVHVSPDGKSRLTEIEAYTPAGVPALTILTGSLSNGTVGVAYSQTLTATGGTSPYIWALSSGTLPSGLSLSSNGVISGTPNAAATSTVTVQVTDTSTPALIATKALTVTVTAAARINVALAVNGGVATASSFLDSRLVPANLINSDRTGVNFATGGGGWHDATLNQYPDWAQVTFSGQKSIDEIDVFTVQDNYANPVEPTPTLTFTKYGPTVLDVQYWDGTTWVTVPGGSVTGNNLVWRKFSFTAVMTDRIRVLVNASPDGKSRLTEIEAYTTAGVPALSILTGSLPDGTVGVAYSQALTATGGAGPYVWSLSSGLLPDGLSLSSTGVISGTPNTAATATITVQVTDTSTPAVTATKSLTIAIMAAARVNVALAANGGVATASSYLDSRLVPANLINGDRTGVNFATGGGGWHDATLNQYPDWAQVTFSGQKSIDEIDVFTVQDNYANPVEPTPTLTFTKYGPTVLDVQYWDGTTWVTVPGGSVTGNSLVWRKFSFTAVTTNRIRVLVKAAPDGKSRLTEIEAYVQ